MPISRYGVLKGRPIDRRLASVSNAHYQIRMVDNDDDYRIAVNVMSQLPPSEVEFIVVDDFQHPILEKARSLTPGWHELPSGEAGPGSMSLDFIRENLFQREDMVPLPFNAPGLDNDLNERLDQHVETALQDETAVMYAFGQRWGPEGAKDKVFGFKPGNGVHDIHMNQGNPEGRFFDDNGVYQDGGLLIDMPRVSRCIGIFLKFQSQAWHTDDVTGAPLTGVPVGPSGPVAPSEPDYRVRILSAIVNPSGNDQGLETLVILNTTAEKITVDQWSIADQQNKRQGLAGVLDPGIPRVVTIKAPVALTNKGGTISLLDKSGLKVHGVSYTKKDAQPEGVSLVF